MRLPLDGEGFQVEGLSHAKRRGVLTRACSWEGPTMTNSSGWNAEDYGGGELEQLERLSEPIRYVSSTANRAVRLEDLAATIENVIVPRLLMNHEPIGTTWTPVGLDAPQIARFADIAMRHEPSAASDYVQSLLNEGIGFDRILLELLAPAARHLGEMWENDTCNFADVTIGVSRMHRILRDFRGVPDRLWSQAGLGHRALLLPVPGEQHTLGLRIVEEFLLREGWAVDSHPNVGDDDVSKLVADEHYDFVGLSLSGETLVDAMFTTIGALRRASRNRHLHVMVGGVIFSEQPELVAKCGADAYAADAAGAVQQANCWAATQQ
jgi:MerR family transcriptional regulator, light-induced transcriptional regulator